MAKRIWIIRHGKSSRPFGVIDHKRPLAKRAGTDAALIRRHLQDGPEVYVASTALRAMETAQMLAGEAPVEPSEALYQASWQEFMGVVEERLAEADQAAFIGHNPAVTDLANFLSDTELTDNVPTLGVACFKQKDTRWQLVDYVTPKGLR